MAETNGSGRMDRVEAALDRLAEIQERDHEEHQKDYKVLLTWQVLMQEKMDRYSEERDRERKRLDEMWANTDRRIADLVTAIGALIQR